MYCKTTNIKRNINQLSRLWLLVLSNVFDFSIWSLVFSTYFFLIPNRCFFPFKGDRRDPVVVILLQLDLQLPMESAHGEVYSILDYVIKFVSGLRGLMVLSESSGLLHQ